MNQLSSVPYSRIKISEASISLIFLVYSDCLRYASSSEIIYLPDFIILTRYDALTKSLPIMTDKNKLLPL